MHTLIVIFANLAISRLVMSSLAVAFYLMVLATVLYQGEYVRVGRMVQVLGALLLVVPAAAVFASIATSQSVLETHIAWVLAIPGFYGLASGASRARKYR